MKRLGRDVDKSAFKARKEEQILQPSKTSRPDVGLNQPPIRWVVGPLGGWKQLGHDVNHSPAFIILVKNEWSFTFDSSICLRDIDKGLPHSSQLYVLGLMVVFNVITLGFRLCFIVSLWMFHWTYELYKISLFLREKIISIRHSCVVTGFRSHFIVWIFCEPSWAIPLNFHHKMKVLKVLKFWITHVNKFKSI